MRAGFRPLEIPVSYKSRGFDEGKKIRILRDPLTWVVAIFKSRFTSLGVDQSRFGATAKSPRSAHRSWNILTVSSEYSVKS